MERWLRQQRALIERPGYAFRTPKTVLPVIEARSPSEIESRIAGAAEQLRALHEAGEIEWTDLNPQAVYEYAFLDD